MTRISRKRTGGSLRSQQLMFVLLSRPALGYVRLNFVYALVGLPLLVESLAEIYFFDSTAWQAVSGWIAGYFL